MSDEKLCRRCREPKPLVDFPVYRGRARLDCRACEADRMRRHRADAGNVGRPVDTDGGMSHAEISRELNIPRSTVQLIEQRAIKKFRAGAIRLGLRDAPIRPLVRAVLTADLRRAGGCR